MTNDFLSKSITAMLDTISSIAVDAHMFDIVEECEKEKHEMSQPLHIAIVGQSNTGKSTLLNALLKKYIVPTGDVVLTYNVNYLRHVKQSANNKEEVKIYLKNGETLIKDLSYLEALLDRTNPDLKELRENVEWIEVFIELDALKQLDLIDTPGLGSFFEEDSANTISLLKSEEHRPDVIAYLATTEFKETDIQPIQEFRNKISAKQKRMSAMNTIAIFTRCDSFIKEVGEDYIPIANRIIQDKHEKFPEFRFAFSKTFAISALYAQGASMLSQDDFNKLKAFASDDAVGRSFKTRERFLSTEKPVIVSAFASNLEREFFADKLGFDTIKYSIWYLQQNPASSIEDLKNELIRYSNVQEVESFIFLNYGKSAKLYKATSRLPLFRRKIEMMYQQIAPEYRSHFDRILNLIDNQLHKLYDEFLVISVKDDYYNKENYFNAVEWDLFRQTMDDTCDQTKLQQQWESNLEFFNLIGDIKAIEATEIIINYLKAIQHEE